MSMLQDLISQATGTKINPDKAFLLPKKNDFSIEDVARSLSSSIGTSASTKDALFYVDGNLYNTNPGFYPEANVIIARATPIAPGMGSAANRLLGDRADKINEFDGDTMYFTTEGLDDGNSPITIGEKSYQSFKHYVQSNTTISDINRGRFGLRFLGINCPEVTHYSIIPKLEDMAMVKKPFEVVEGELNYAYDRTKNRKAGDILTFVQTDTEFNDQWNEVVDDNYIDDKIKDDMAEQIKDHPEFEAKIRAMTYYKIVYSDESEPNAAYQEAGLSAKRAVANIISGAEEILIMIDHKTINKRSGSSPDKYNDDYWTDSWNLMRHPFGGIRRAWETAFGPIGYRYLGYNNYGQDAYKRFLGTMYVKKRIPELGGVSAWINVSKYVLQSVGQEIEVLPEYNSDPLQIKNNSFSADAFKLWSYNTQSEKIVDAIGEISSNNFETVRKLQKDLVGIDFEQARDYTVMIGDCLFMVPPTSIRSVTQTSSEKVSLLRSRGSMVKSSPQSDRLIEMHLYFNSADGVNGVPTTRNGKSLIKLPNGKEITYYMNGLRQLISMFKLTPFLPIDNHYINEVLNIEAVSLANMQVSTVPGYPQCLAVVLTLEEFNYHVYMPEIPTPDYAAEESLNKNMFAGLIDYELMRWHTQQPILKGESIKNLDFNSPEYIQQTFGNKTALQPMKFESSSVEFFVTNKEFLDQQLKLKIESMNRPLKTQNTVTAEMKSWAKQLATVYDIVLAVNSNEDFVASMLSLNTREGDYGLTIMNPSANEHNFERIYRNNAPYGMLDETHVRKLNFEGKELGSDAMFRMFDNIYRSFKNHLGNVISGMWMTEDVNVNDTSTSVVWNMDIAVDTSVVQSSVYLNNFLKILSGELGLQIETFFVNNAVRLSISASFDSDGETIDGFYFDTESPGMQMLQRCAIAYGTEAITDADVADLDAAEWAGLVSDEMQDTLSGQKQSIDVETTESLKFDKYEIGEVHIKNIACVFGNTLSKMNLKAIDGKAPQYCGGQDTIIEISLETMDENAVSLLNALPRIAAAYARDYRLVLPCWPLRINSELTRMLGVNEVLIESVDINTVPGQPGLYTIEMRLMSVDRTVRNKEAMKKLEVASNAGSISTDSTSNVVVKGYFDLQSTLAKAEVYPDLELPTIDEMKEAGFRFVSDATKDSYRVYPDPDFYFVYNHVLGNEIIRTAILNYTADSPEYEITDRYGASITISPQANNAFTQVNQNETAKTMADQRDVINKILQETMARKRTEKSVANQQIVDVYTQMQMYQTWDICEDIRCMFRERKYANVMDKNDSLQKKIQARVDEVCAEIDVELSRPIGRMALTPEWNDKGYIKSVSDNNQSSAIYDAVKKVTKQYFSSTGSLRKAADLLESDLDSPSSSSPYAEDAIVKKLTPMIMAAADAASGEMEYVNKKSRTDWQARGFLYPESVSPETIGFDPADPNRALLTPFVMISKNSQAEIGKMFASSLEEAVTYGTSFGPFQVRTYSKVEASGISGIPISSMGDRFFIDPYYLKAQMAGDEESKEIVENYKRWISMDMEASATAFVRNMLVWMKVLLQEGILLSVFELVQDEAMAAIGSLDYGNVDVAGDPVGARKVADERAAAKLQAEADKKDREKVQEEAIESGTMTQEQADAENALIAEAEAQLDQQAAANETLIKNIKAMLKDSKAPLAVGKFFATMMMTLSSGDTYLHDLMRARDYEALNQITRGAQVPNASQIPILKKYVLAMAGRELFALEELGKQSESLAELMGNLVNEMYTIKAADDPSQYILHSFYDMIQNDKRGRMTRAFPTYYMMFVDEGREIGLWKMHDNFYNMSAISEIQVVKSRKVASDTARIVMTNMFKTYTTDDEDSKELALDNDVLKNYQYSFRDTWNSVFSPRTYFMQEELKRMETLPANRVKLKPGVRIHLRIGYGSDASTLPIVFNGVIAEVGAGEVMEITAQGDGVELTNPILSTSDAEDIQHEDTFVIGRIFKNWMTKGATPRTILGSILTSKGGWVKKKVYEVTNGRYFNRNPYGIIHFGEPAFQDIFQNGEVTQNIYEGASRPGWANEGAIMSMLSDEYSLDDAPRISTQIFGKSYWDIMHICASASPDYIASVVPFGFRSSIFYGAPRFYCAYEYAKSRGSQDEIDQAYEDIDTLQKKLDSTDIKDNEIQSTMDRLLVLREKISELGTNSETIIKEKRKPFQQYHIYNSYADIISNDISSSSQDVRTCAIGLYEAQGVFARKSMKRVGPLWVDYDIYPEYQKTMTVDTQLVAKGTAILGDIIPFFNLAQNELADTTGMIQGGYELAWRMTATALKNSIKDMYQGALIVIGDPTVKPYDKMWIEDINNRMQGNCEVEAVVHNFDVANGYTTSIYADCVATIDDRHEKIVQSWGNNIVAKAGAAYAGVVIGSTAFAMNSRPLLRALTNYATKAGTLASKSVNNIATLLGKEELLNNEAALNLGDDVKRTLGINSSTYKLSSYTTSAAKWQNVLKPIHADRIKTLADLASHYDSLAKTMTTVNPDDLLQTMMAVQNSGTLSPSALAEMELATDALKIEQLKVTEALKSVDISKSKDSLRVIMAKASSVIDGQPDNLIPNQAIRNSVTDLNLLLELDVLEDPADVKRLADAMRVLSVNAGEVNGLEALKTLTTSSDEMMQAVKSSLSVVDDVVRVVGKEATIVRGAKLAVSLGRGAIAGIAVSMALEMAITYAITSFVYEYIERWMKNLQVLQIFPIKKDGMAMTAGLNGSKGVVVGSPSYNDEGTIKSWLGNLFADRGNGYDWIRDMVASTEMKEIAARFRRRADIPDPDTVVGRVSIAANLMKSIASDEMLAQQQGYNSMLMLGRIATMDGRNSEAAEAYKNYAIKSVETVAINNDIKENMVPLQYTKRIEDAISAGYFKLMHIEGIPQNKRTIDNSEVVYANQTITFNLQGTPKPVGAIRANLSDSKYIYDLPFLRPDAYALVEQIMEKVETKYNYNSENVNEKDKIKDHPIILHSALRAGENKWTSTGFVFRIQVVGEDMGALLSDIEADQEKHYASLGESGKKYFQSIKRSSDMYDISVFPPNKGYNTAAFTMLSAE